MEAIKLEVQKVIEVTLVPKTCQHCDANFAVENNRRQKHCPECCQPIIEERKAPRKLKSHGRPDMPLSSIAGKMKYIRKHKTNTRRFCFAAKG